MTNHDFEVDLEALATAVTKLSELQERNQTYDVARLYAKLWNGC